MTLMLFPIYLSCEDVARVSYEILRADSFEVITLWHFCFRANYIVCCVNHNIRDYILIRYPHLNINSIPTSFGYADLVIYEHICITLAS